MGKRSKIPQFLRPLLWSSDFNQLDIQKHKNIIIKNILDLGDEQATDWLRKIFTKNEIKKVIHQSSLTEWSKKSINLWSFIYNTRPKKSRFLK